MLTQITKSFANLKSGDVVAYSDSRFEAEQFVCRIDSSKSMTMKLKTINLTPDSNITIICFKL